MGPKKKVISFWSHSFSILQFSQEAELRKGSNLTYNTIIPSEMEQKYFHPPGNPRLW